MFSCSVFFFIICISSTLNTFSISPICKFVSHRTIDNIAVTLQLDSHFFFSRTSRNQWAITKPIIEKLFLKKKSLDNIVILFTIFNEVTKTRSLLKETNDSQSETNHPVKWHNWILESPIRDIILWSFHRKLLKSSAIQCPKSTFLDTRKCEKITTLLARNIMMTTPLVL